MRIAPMTRYEDTRAHFRWELPERFNFGQDVVDHLAATDDRLALRWTSDHAAPRQFLFSDVARQSSRMAHVLKRAGLVKGDRIIVQLPRIPEWHLVMTACTKLGLVVIPCIEMLTAKDLAYRIQYAGAAAAVTTPDNTTKYPTGDPALATLRARLSIGPVPGWLDLLAEAAREPDSIDCAPMAAEDPALMYYTSGSSGMPKGVLHASRAIWAWRYSAAYWQGIGPGDLNWCTADTGWAKSGTGVLFSPWGVGSAVLFHQGVFDPRRRLQVLSEEGVTVFCAAATEFRHLVQQDLTGLDLSRLRLCVSAGESVNPEVVRRWFDLTGVRLLDGYGQTETLMTILNYPAMPVKPGSMGRPLPGCDFSVLDPDGRALPAGEVGQIAMRLPHPQFMLGYWQAPDKTAAAISADPDTPGQQHWLTGDLGYQDADGYFFYTGRADDIISSAGYRIGPMEVENALMQHPAVLETAVIGKPDAERGEIVKAFVVLKPGHTGDDALVAELQAHVKRVTAPFKYPREIRFVTDLPKSAAGKLLRRELRQQESATGGTA